jgi:hypothetical protein
MKEIELWSNTIWDYGPRLEIILEFWPKGLKHFWLRVGTIFKHCGGVLYLKFVKQLVW